MRLEINDFFIDEYEINNSIRYEEEKNSLEKTILLPNSELFLKLRKSSEWLLTPEYKNRIALLAKKSLNIFPKDAIIRFYEVDENILKDTNTFTINFDCSGNNYTNGFITKHSLIKIFDIYCFPSSVLKNFKNFFQTFLTIDNEFRKNCVNIEQIKNYYKRKLPFFNVWTHNLIKKENLQYFSWYNKNLKKIIESKHMEWISDIGFLKIKFNTDMLHFNQNNYEKFLIDLYEIYTLANKYKQYENQRNID